MLTIQRLSPSYMKTGREPMRNGGVSDLCPGTVGYTPTLLYLYDLRA